MHTLHDMLASSLAEHLITASRPTNSDRLLHALELFGIHNDWLSLEGPRAV